MAPLATTADVEDRLGRSLTSAETDRIDGLLADASATVRTYTGQQFTKATTTDKLRIRRGVIRLPQLPVEEVTAVVDANGNAIAYTFDGIDRLQVGTNVLDSFSFVPWRTPLNVLTVTYEHGYDDIPDDIVAVVCSIASRSLGVNPTAAAVTQEAVGPFSHSIGSIGAAGAIGFLPAERETLDRYRRVGGFVITGPT